MRFAAVLRSLLYAAMALVLAGGWAVMYLQSRAADPRTASAILATLRQLGEADARWNDRLIGLRAGTVPVEEAQLPPRGLGSLIADLELKGLQLSPPLAGYEITALKLAFREKEVLIRRYAAARTEIAFQSAYFSSTGPRLDTLMRAFERSFSAALDEAELWRVLLIFYSGFLLVVLAWFAWRLTQTLGEIRRINLALQDANEGLERRVAERTRELSETLDRLKESEAMLVQSEKMSSLGQMVAGLAHEVNTPLAYVKSSLDAVRGRIANTGRLATEVERLIALLESDDADEDTLASQFATVKELLGSGEEGGTLEGIDRLVSDGLHGVGQVAELVGNLKNFSRLDRAKVSAYDLNEGVESALVIARHTLTGRTVKKLLGNLPRVQCSPSQVNQVFLNLITNAAQATPEQGGTILVRTLVRDPEHVAVEVVDNGHGIPPEVKSKIFDPFFTTKEIGKGTGLGLSICYKIVQDHGGTIELDSEPGKGTRFTVVLPLKPPAADPAP